MMLQAIPVLHFFSSHKAVFYTYIDEEKPEHKVKLSKEKDDLVKDYNQALFAFQEEENKFLFPLFIEKQHPSPFLEFSAPPPDAC